MSMIWNLQLKMEFFVNLITIPLLFNWTQSDIARKKNVFAKKSKQKPKKMHKNLWDEKRLWIELAKVRKGSSEKIYRLRQFVEERPETLNSAVLFVLDREHGEDVKEVIKNFGSFNQYYSDENKRLLELFSI